jgi:hypothetical protein
VLDLYHYAHNQGFRPDMEMSILNIVADKQQPQTDDWMVGETLRDG